MVIVSRPYLTKKIEFFASEPFSGDYAGLFLLCSRRRLLVSIINKHFFGLFCDFIEVFIHAHPLSSTLACLHMNFSILTLNSALFGFFLVYVCIQSNKTHLSSGRRALIYPNNQCRIRVFFPPFRRLSSQQKFIFEEGHLVIMFLSQCILFLLVGNIRTKVRWGWS